MNIYITLDYELFFGSVSGSVERCMIEPTEALMQLVEPYGVKFSCFVDAGYLKALKRQSDQYPELHKSFEQVGTQLKKLVANGHGIELHVHPHWEDSYYDKDRWLFNTDRYRLSYFSEAEVLNIITEYNLLLTEISGQKPVAYRAGGWSAQPFPPIAKALNANKILKDSSVYPGGLYKSAYQWFNFEKVPQYKTYYKFSEDLTVEDIAGPFSEFPISSYLVSPLFYWKLVATKILKTPKHRPYGNGSAIPLAKAQKLRLLSRYSRSVISIDGYKASFLEKAFKKYQKHTDGDGNFVIIGHPKSFTPYSMNKLDNFLKKTSQLNRYTTFR